MQPNLEKYPDADMRKLETKLVIVGAGISGLSASINLINKNYHDFLVLEADSKIGGRCFTLKCN